MKLELFEIKNMEIRSTEQLETIKGGNQGSIGNIIVAIDDITG